MSSSLKPLVLHGHERGPNPWKVVIILEELSIPFEYKLVKEVKAEPFTKLNPNGRVPAIEDPNTGITLWESGAIIQYLVDQYDKEGKISYQQLAEKYQQQQWLMFQVSGQGPYFGQAFWFTMYHPEKIQSAMERYYKEIERVTMVLDNALAGKQWLVGDKCTYADLSFVPWYEIVPKLLKDNDFETKYPNYSKWMAAMNDRESVKKFRAQRAELTK